MTVVLDDHLIRDWMTGRDEALVDAVADETVATTNLWYVRLCKSAARATGGAILRGWNEADRRALIAGLVALPDDISVVPMRQLAWKMAELTVGHNGLSALGAEAVAAAIALPARVLVSTRDDGPGIRQCCATVGVVYDALPR
ncbi:MAG: hypothetical protein SGJ13_14645 [Actinomycetota bacterium]|nr:hypothetical protein [Actinomycetota bacterium]